jgi:hypothetical protein
VTKDIPCYIKKGSSTSQMNSFTRTVVIPFSVKSSSSSDAILTIPKKKKNALHSLISSGKFMHYVFNIPALSFLKSLLHNQQSFMFHLCLALCMHVPLCLFPRCIFPLLLWKFLSKNDVWIVFVILSAQPSNQSLIGD